MLVLIKQKDEITEYGSWISDRIGINIDLKLPDLGKIGTNIAREISKGYNNTVNTIAKAHVDVLKEGGRGVKNVVRTVAKAGRDVGEEAKRARREFARSDIGRSDIGRITGDVVIMGVGTVTETVKIQTGIAEGLTTAAVETGTGIIKGTSQLAKGHIRGAETIYKAGIAGAEKAYKAAFAEPMEKSILNFYLSLPEPTDLGPLGKVSRDDMFSISLVVVGAIVTILTAGTGSGASAAAYQSASEIAKATVKHSLMQTMKTWVAEHFTAQAIKELGKNALIELVKQKGIEVMTGAMVGPVEKYNLDKTEAEYRAQQIANEAAFEMYCDTYDCSKPTPNENPDFEKYCKQYKCQGLTQQPIQSYIEANKKEIDKNIIKKDVKTQYTDPKLPYILGGIGLIAAMTLFGGD